MKFFFGCLFLFTACFTAFAQENQRPKVGLVLSGGGAKGLAHIGVLKVLEEQGVKIDGIGMQGHVSIDGPSIEEFEKSIETYAALGVKVMITELDMTVLKMPDPSVGAEVSASFEYKQELNPYVDGLPDSINTIYEQRYLDFFKLFLKHQDKISRVTLWGVNDSNSWKNDWPIFGRTDYCLLFDRQNQPKPVVAKIIEEALKQK